MAIDLDKISSELEESLERARVLAEQRQHALITPAHMLYVMLDKESPLAAMLEKSGVACGPLLDALSTRLNRNEGTQKLEPGKRSSASRSLRDLIEKSFKKMTARGAERAEPIDLLQAVVETGE